MSKKDHNLCIDIGNSYYKLGVFLNDEIVLYKKTDENGLPGVLTDLQAMFSINNMIVSSVRKNIHNAILGMGAQLNTNIILDNNTPLPITINYKTPETLGNDRIAAAVGANFLYPGEGIIVVDSGTCITYDFIDKNAVFQGGNIAPGLHMRLQAMHDYTSQLPLPDLEKTDNLLGKSTTEALQNGAMQGTIFEIDSFIRQINKKYGDSRLILTGGDAIYFVDYFKSMIFVVQNLVLIGLNKIINYNA